MLADGESQNEEKMGVNEVSAARATSEARAVGAALGAMLGNAVDRQESDWLSEVWVTSTATLVAVLMGNQIVRDQNFVPKRVLTDLFWWVKDVDFGATRDFAQFKKRLEVQRELKHLEDWDPTGPNIDFGQAGEQQGWLDLWQTMWPIGVFGHRMSLDIVCTMGTTWARCWTRRRFTIDGCGALAMLVAALIKYGLDEGLMAFGYMFRQMEWHPLISSEVESVLDSSKQAGRPFGHLEQCLRFMVDGKTPKQIQQMLTNGELQGAVYCALAYMLLGASGGTEVFGEQAKGISKMDKRLERGAWWGMPVVDTKRRYTLARDLLKAGSKGDFALAPLTQNTDVV